jgi:hypothetical protein
VVLILQKFDEYPTRRRLLAESRYTDTPPQLTFALDPGGYRVETEQAQVAERYAEVLDALPAAPADPSPFTLYSSPLPFTLTLHPLAFSLLASVPSPFICALCVEPFFEVTSRSAG